LHLFPRTNWPARITIAAIGVTPGALLCAPGMGQLVSSVGLALGGALRLAVLSTLMVWLLAPLVVRARAADLGLLAGSGAVAGLLFFVWGGFSAKIPQQEPASIYYALDADSGEAIWMRNSGKSEMNSVFDPRLSSLLEQRREYSSAKLSGSHLVVDYASPGGRVAFVVSQAPPLSLTAPKVLLLAENKNENHHIYRLLLSSPRHAGDLRIEVRGAQVFAFILNGKKVERSLAASASAQSDIAAHYWQLNYANLPVNGIELSVETAANTPLEIQVADYSEGLPADREHIPAPGRGQDLPPFPGGFTIVVKTFKF